MHGVSLKLGSAVRPPTTIFDFTKDIVLADGLTRRLDIVSISVVTE